ncbi:MAG: tyrosine-type recombinase/integrase, partial [Candidatus Bathyarchaeota archaeon]|nr:tyrosine-type recombinase/integrase [Candidatus Bathyarchaeota archaeon]
FIPLIGKSMILCLASSGMRVGELLQLRESSVDFTKTPVMVTIPSAITKTKKKRVTFISQESVKILKEWLDYKPKWLETAQVKSITPITDQGRLYPISDSSFRELWKRSTAKAKLDMKDETTKRLELRIHMLRKFFRTYGKWTQPDIAEALIGHLGGIEEIYARFSENQLRQAYLEAEPNLTILGAVPNLKELQEQMQEQYKGVDRIIASLSIKNQELENTLQKKDTDFKQKFAEIDEQLKGQDELIRDMRERISNFINQNVRMDEWYAELRKKESDLEKREKALQGENTTKS